jgi:hypothetical protein
MTLHVENQKKINDPSREQIMEAISSLRTPSPSFAILSHSRMEYVQIAFGKGGGLVLEYQDGSIKDHFQSKRSDLTATEVADVFYAFGNGQTNWKHSLEWDRTEIRPKPSLISRVSSVSLLIGLVMAVPFLYGIQEDDRVARQGTGSTLPTCTLPQLNRQTLGSKPRDFIENDIGCRN